MHSTLLCLVSLLCLTSATNVSLTIKTDACVHIVDDSFLSTALDFTLLAPGVNWGPFDFNSPRLQTLLSGLWPSILRIGGTPADSLFFDLSLDLLNTSSILPQPFVIQKVDIDNLIKLTRITGTRLLYDLNLQLRFGLQWDPSNTIRLLDYCQYMDYGENMDFELGNEPTNYNRPNLGQISGKQIGDDFISLRKLIGRYKNFVHSRLVGPDLAGITSGASETVMAAFAKEAGSYLNAFTIHHYYFAGNAATWKDYIRPDRFASLASDINEAKKLASVAPSVPLWIGETSDAYNSGTVNVSDRYISGFLWLDKLGLSALMGVDVVVRQTLYGYKIAHNYALLDDNLNPNPDYWLSYVHKQLVGRSVLNCSLATAQEYIRVYAHCTKTSLMYPEDGPLTVFALNVHPTEPATIYTAQFQEEEMDVFLLTPTDNDILSQQVALNGITLKMVDDYTMPALNPQKGLAKNGIKLPPLTFGFFVYPTVRLEACRERKTVKTVY